MSTNQRIYLDHAATTPVDRFVIDEMQNFFISNWHNPSSIYFEGQKAARAIDEARMSIAKMIGAQPEEIYFTSGGSESNNLAIKGIIDMHLNVPVHVLTSATEHHAVIDPIELLSHQNKITFSTVTPDKEGIIHSDEVIKNIKKDTKFISIMHANNEVGAINDIKEIVDKVKFKRPDIIFHSDSVQYVAHYDIDVKKLGVDLLTLTGHKFYGPRGCGILYIKSGVKIVPQILGGGQENNIRAGTENLAAIIGLSKALEISINNREKDIKRDQLLFEQLQNGLKKSVPDIGFTGPKNIQERIPGMLSMLVDGVEGESILLALDIQGIAASSGSACSTGSIEPSHVLTAMGIPSELARGSLRLSIGRMNNEENINDFLQILPSIIKNLRSMSSQKKQFKKIESEWLNN